MDRMVAILRDAGLKTNVGRYSIRIRESASIVFREYGGDLGDPCLDGDADTLEDMMRDAKRVSDALARAGIRHRFSVYDAADNLVGYLHHEWPLEDWG